MEQEILKKLRYNGGQAAVLHAPDGYGFGLNNQAAEDCDFVLLYVHNAEEGLKQIEGAIPLLKEDAVFWICYPKQSAKIKTDLNRDTLAALVMEHTAYRPVSNVAIDEKWSALRFRLKEKVKSGK